MKRTLQIVFALAAVLMFSVQALAADPDQFWTTNADGEQVFDYGAYDLAVAQEAVEAAEVDIDPSSYFFVDGGINRFDNAAFTAALDAAVAAKDKPQPKPDESAGTKNEQVFSPADNVADNSQYPVGSYVDEAGNVFSADGELLSPGTTPAGEPVGDTALPGDVLDTQSASEVGTVDEAASLEIIAGLVSDIANDPATYKVVDMRKIDPDVSVLSGLKALVSSIFGSYTPVTTTAVIPETTGNDITYRLITVVADGAAGVDYEWCAGVLLFGILLYCLMKLLGGVLK